MPWSATMFLPHYLRLFVAFFFLCFTQLSFAHCQVPCGLYDDHARVMSMLEDVSTIEKAVTEMSALSDKKDAQSQNQMIRWVVTKEQHAQHIIETISDYFLTQRVKLDQKDYEKRLIHHHHVIVSAMNAKQNADISFATKLRKAILALAPYYPEHSH
jgi:nickel superoxide dismutase